MPEVKENLEQSSQIIEKQESLPQAQEQRESIKISEKVSETEEVQVSEEKNNISDDSQVGSGQQQVVDSPMSDRLKKAVDEILEEGLEDIYLNLSKETQKEFKAKGEETTNKINILLGETKIKVKKIVQAIVEWLRLVPGINKFFIKQTAKIKTDKILAAKNREENIKND
jgi:hypothetical protein